MKNLILLIFSTFLYHSNHAQVYTDYIGAGHSVGVNVSSSDAQSDGLAAVDGSGLGLDIRGSSRFLAHATVGYTMDDVQALTQTSIPEWIDEQLNMPLVNYTIPTVEIVFEMLDQCYEKYGVEFCTQNFAPNTIMWRYAWWDHAMKQDDQLRQRVAMALSEILVISDQSDLDVFPHGLAAYYDILYNHAFGNFRDLLAEVTLNPSMGYYLSHINNPKAIEALNTKPDENYAREIMQLFSIGLYELNPDGSQKIDMGTGTYIPTYDNEDIQGLARVFTGLSGSKWADPANITPVKFGRNWRRYSLLDPMIMYEEWHEPGEKNIIGNYTIPAGQSGMDDINQAIDHLFNHDNVGPFLTRRLIQRLVKSNPTNAYIERVAEVFNNNGSGVRGDLSAVIRSILIDPEAMECYWVDDPDNGMLRSPMLRYTQLMKGLKAETESEEFWNSGLLYQQLTEQHTLSAPTVFNFYSPDYTPNADFALYNLEGPEYQILNSSTSSNYVNYMFIALMRDYINNAFGLTGTNQEIPNYLNEPFVNRYLVDPNHYDATLSDEKWLSLVPHPDDLVDYLDILMCNGSLNDVTRARIASSVSRSDIFDPVSAARYAAFLIMIDPDFVVMK